MSGVSRWWWCLCFFFFLSSLLLTVVKAKKAKGQDETRRLWMVGRGKRMGEGPQ